MTTKFSKIVLGWQLYQVVQVNQNITHSLTPTPSSDVRYQNSDDGDGISSCSVDLLEPLDTAISLRGFY